MDTAVTQPPTRTPDAIGSSATEEQVWERIWRHRPSDAKDDMLLAREQSGLRWKQIVKHAVAAFGSIRGLRTIEMGSGRGDLSVLLARSGADVTLLDQSAKALDEARRRFDRVGLDAGRQSGDILGKLDRWSGRFDVSLSSGVIEHFTGSDRLRVVRAHLDVLKPGGLAIISVPHSRCPPYRLWKAYLQIRRWWPYGVEIPYSRREIASLARKSGLVDIETQCYGFWQSIGNLWGKDVFKRNVDWTDKRSRLDGLMGMNLLLFARRPGSSMTGDALDR